LQKCRIRLASLSFEQSPIKALGRDLGGNLDIHKALEKSYLRRFDHKQMLPALVHVVR
jgi:hypothetical protein